MKPETLFWQTLKPYIPGHKERIENAAGVGMPDVHWTYDGKSNWLELKVAKKHGQTVHELLEPSQHVWHKKAVCFGGRVYVAVKYCDNISIYKAFRHGIQIQYVKIFEMVKPWQWKHFEEVIKNL